MRSKKIWRVLALTLEAVLLLAVAAAVLVQMPSVQTAVIRKAARMLEKDSDAKVSIGAIRILPFRTLVIRDLTIMDTQAEAGADTLAHIRRMSATFSLKGLDFRQKGGLKLDRVRVDGAIFNLVISDRGGFENNVSAVFRIPKSEDELREIPDLVSIRRADVTDFRFRMINLLEDNGYTYSGFGVNWADLDLTAEAHGRNINYVDSRCSMEITDAALCEKSGYSAKFRGDCITGMGLADITDFHLKDAWSDFNVRRFTMGYSLHSDWSSFPDRIVMGGSFEPTVLAMRSLAYYMGYLQDCPIVAEISEGSVSGPVNALRITGLKAKDRYSGLSLDLNLRLGGITDISSARADADIRRLSFDAPTAGKLMSAFGLDRNSSEIAGFAPGVRADLSGRIHGKLNALNIDCQVITNAGDVRVTAATGGLTSKTEPLSYNGVLAVDDLDLGRISGAEGTGLTSFAVRSSGILPTDGAQPEIKIDSIRISKLTLMDYPYGGITGKGVLKDGIFDGWVNCQDPNLKFLFNGGVSIDAGNFTYGRFFLNIWHADLKATKLDTRPGESAASGYFDIKLRKTKDNTLLGTANGNSLEYRDEKGRYDIGDFALDIRNNEEKKLNRVTLDSDFMEFGYNGDLPIEEILEPLLAATVGNSVPALLEGTVPQTDGHHFVAKLKMKDTRKILAPLKMAFNIPDGTGAEAELKGNGDFGLNFEAPMLAFGQVQAVLPYISISCSGGKAGIDAGTEGLRVGEFNLRNLKIRADARDNDIDLLLHTETDEVQRSAADLHLATNLVRDRRKGNRLVVFGSIPDSWITVSGEIWNISEPDIRWCTDSLTVYGLGLANRSQSISIDGGISKKFDQKLNIRARDFSLSTISRFLPSSLNLDGEIEADLTIGTHRDANTDIQGSITCPQLKFGGRSAGTLAIRAEMDPEDFEMLNFSVLNSTAIAPDAFKLTNGSFNLASGVVRAKATLNGFDIGIAEEFVREWCSDLSGQLDGSISVNGNIRNANFIQKGIRCDALGISGGHVLLKPTGAEYDIDGRLRYTQGLLTVDRLTLRDKADGAATVSGTPDEFAVQLDNIRVLDKRNDGSPFYGRLAIGGGLRLKGLSEGNATLQGSIATAGEGDVSIVTAFGSTGEKVLLTFAEPADTSVSQALLLPPAGKEDNGALAVDCRIVVSPQVKLTAFLDKSASNVISANGSGDISIGYDSVKGDILLGGDYTISEGKCHFAALSSLITKDFIIENGSSVKFAGDPMDSELDIRATQILKKVSIGPLISDTTAVHTEKKVLCQLGISDKLTNPQLSFDIRVPDLDPATNALVESELNTEDKRQKQFLALVLTGNFLPNETTGITDNNLNSGSNLILKNLSSIMSGQVNSVLQKMGVPVDFGVSYQQNEIGKDIVDVALSTNLFSDRVQVDGSIANRRYSTTSDDEVVGDLDIGIKLDRTGELKLKMFSHSADDYTSFLDNTQRNGVGITYQKEFDSLRDYLRSLFRKEKNQSVLQEGPVKTIDITK